jgi:hypothetical protein
MTYVADPSRPGVALLALFHDDVEDVRLERWASNAAVNLDVPAGAELLVLDGSFEHEGERFEPLSWLRLPADNALRATAGAQGCRLWTKTGHLLKIQGDALLGTRTVS